MKTLPKVLLVISGIAVFLQPAFGHHSIAAVFNQKEEATISGIVSEFHFVNPHANLRIKVTDENGVEEEWDIEMDGRLNLTNGNITAASFTPGERLEVTGFPSHIKSPILFFLSATREDGTEVLPPRQERRKSLEEERRLRRLQQDSNSGN